jgi:hypothetical protein
MDQAEQFGCAGVLGLHWRHRIMDADAALNARYSWDKTLQPEGFFKAFAAVQARAPRASNLAQVLDDTDRDRLILCSFTGEIKDGHHQINEYSGDYSEAFRFWLDYAPPPEVMKSQAKVAANLRQLTAAASSPAERERLNYLARFVEFLTPYSESWVLSSRLHNLLQQALELKKQGKADEARQKVLAEGVPLWLKLAPKRHRSARLAAQQVRALGAFPAAHVDEGISGRIAAGNGKAFGRSVAARSKCSATRLHPHATHSASSRRTRAGLRRGAWTW